jgi:type VI secretion system protein ImpE
MGAAEHYKAGRLQDAIQAAVEDVKKAPLDVERRSFLAELLCVAGDLDRADAQLEALQKTGSAGPGVAMMRQLVRGERARHEFHGQGRLPEFVTQPSAATQLALRASIAIRDGDLAGAAELLAQHEEQRAKPRGRCDGAAFEDVRDADDLTAGVLEVLSSTGKFFWIPFDALAEIELDKPTRPIDLLWRAASISMRGGSDGRVHVCTTYASHGARPDDAARMARSTDWIGNDGEPVRGVGAKTLLVGEEPKTLLEIRRLEFEAAS